MENIKTKLDKATAILKIWKDNKDNPSWNEIAEITIEALEAYVAQLDAYLQMGLDEYTAEEITTSMEEEKVHKIQLEILEENKPE